MSTTLGVLLGVTADAPASWALRDDEAGALIDAGGAARARDLTGLPEADKTVLIAPGTDVLTRCVETPAKSESQFRAAAPFLLEDHVATSMDGQHLAIGPAPAASGAARVVAAVSRAKMDEWRELLDELGLRASRIVADYAAFACRPGEANVADLGDRLAVAICDGEGVRTGFAIEATLGSHTVPNMLHEAGVRVVILQGGDEALAAACRAAGLEVRHAAPLGARAQLEAALEE
ncbi:MAG: type II secretion system protein GspL, partial [Pseudomonadota bacterium]